MIARILASRPLRSLLLIAVALVGCAPSTFLLGPLIPPSHRQVILVELGMLQGVLAVWAWIIYDD
ncbi:MAG: hypothetical protein QOH47_2437 [Sphingomonadales bacterium]|jgi:hypothetical protein|nr:hypothetical protein [Sphingomonadales bacterium]